jgi:hypothetical protein
MKFLPTKRTKNAPFESTRGTGEGGRKLDITTTEGVSAEGVYDLVDHVPRYRMVHVGGHPLNSIQDFLLACVKFFPSERERESFSHLTRSPSYLC